MKQLFLLPILFFAITTNIFSQDDPTIIDTGWKNTYRAFAEKQNDLLHTKLVAGFDYTKSQLNGEVWLQLKPHFYATNILTLDAKGMNIYEVAIYTNNKLQKLTYNYDSLLLHIILDRTYNATEKYTVYIKYTAKPNDYKANGSAAITDAKGLYFINPLGTDPSKPTQIWTQGETEGTSVWIPTIDKPNQKCTQEFQLIVPSKYVSLSNGLLVKQIDNKNGTRLDIWKMDQPHSPYLFFIGIGDYAIVKDSYKVEGTKTLNEKKNVSKVKKKIEISYYIEKEYVNVAKQIYGRTPDMIAYYEKTLGIKYPWDKYAQISGHDYVSGAMENTTCTLHGDGVQQNARELKDGNAWESTIAHELFHQWFGDLVTAESWSNLTVNESFADYSEVLWASHSQGKDAGDYENYTSLKRYLGSPVEAEKKLVRFYYFDKEDMFDLVSYQKGGRILHMLRHFVGDEAFFASLHKYLEDNKFGNGSAVKLKLAFESITGKDLNWFFNQWYFDNGHPYVRIAQQYIADKKQVLVTIQQTQTQEKVFELPVGIDVYVNNQRNHYEVWSKHRIDSFYFPAANAPNNINVDNDKILLWDKDESKPFTQYAFQYTHARNLVDRLEAVNEASENLASAEAKQLIKLALNDPFYVLRVNALHSYNPLSIDDSIEAIIAEKAGNDPSTLVRQEAIDIIAALDKNQYKEQFIKWAKDSSYLVSGAALEALVKIDSVTAKKMAVEFSKQVLKKRLNNAVTNIISKYGDENDFDFIAAKYKGTNSESTEKFYLTPSFAELLAKINDPIKFKIGIDLIVAFRESIPQEYRVQSDTYFNAKILGSILKAKKQQGQQKLVDIVLEQLPKL